jgi:hypothetical protein
MQGAKQEDLQQHRTVLPETVNFGVREQAAIGGQGTKEVIFVLSLFAFVLQLSIPSSLLLAHPSLPPSIKRLHQ